MPDQPHTRQKAEAGRDAYIAGRDLTVNVFGAAGPDVAGIPGLRPRDVPAFTGRSQELERLTALAGGGRVVVSAIGGTAGVGKTALAIHAAHQLLDEFPGGHLYADLRGYTEGQDPAGPGEVLQVFLRRLGVPAEEVPAGLEQAVAEYERMLGANSLPALTARGTLGGAYVESGRADEGIQMIEDAIAALTALCGNDDPNVVRLQEDLDQARG